MDPKISNISNGKIRLNFRGKKWRIIFHLRPEWWEERAVRERVGG